MGGGNVSSQGRMTDQTLDPHCDFGIQSGDLVRLHSPNGGCGSWITSPESDPMLVLQVAPICDLEGAAWPAALVLRSDGSRKTYLTENLTLCEKAEENK